MYNYDKLYVGLLYAILRYWRKIMRTNQAIFNMDNFHMVPMEVIEGFEVRTGMYEINGATAIPGGVNFTVSSDRKSVV